MAEPELIPPPLDAYATAKPDEPTWTVQGGDPLGGPLLRIWAAFARLRAGVITPGAVNTVFEEVRTAANNRPPENERERDSLLIRASQTEDVSWDMDAYLKGHTHELVEETDDNTPEELERIDLHDYRVRSAQKLNNMVAELTEILHELGRRDPVTDYGPITGCVADIKDIAERVEPRRIFKKED